MTIEFSVFELVFVLNISLDQQFWIFLFKFALKKLFQVGKIGT